MAVNEKKKIVDKNKVKGKHIKSPSTGEIKTKQRSGNKITEHKYGNPTVASSLKRNQIIQLEKKARPFISGTSTNKTHNINVTIQTLNMARKKARIEANKVHFSAAARIPPKSEPPEAIESGFTDTTKVKAMFVALHNEFSDLLQTHSKLEESMKGEEGIAKLKKAEETLNKKLLQINVVMSLYDENLRLREELKLLRRKEMSKIGFKKRERINYGDKNKQ